MHLFLTIVILITYYFHFNPFNLKFIVNFSYLPIPVIIFNFTFILLQALIILNIIYQEVNLSFKLQFFLFKILFFTNLLLLFFNYRCYSVNSNFYLFFNFNFKDGFLYFNYFFFIPKF